MAKFIKFKEIWISPDAIDYFSDYKPVDPMYAPYGTDPENAYGVSISFSGGDFKNIVCTQSEYDQFIEMLRDSER